MKFTILVKQLIILILSTLLFSCATSTGPASKNTSITIPSTVQSGDLVLERNKQTVRQYKKLQFSDDKSNLLSANHRLIRSEFQNLATNAQDPAIQAIAEPLHIAIPDRVDNIEVMVAEGNIVGVQTRITGTHKGNLYGIPATGKTIDIVSTAFYTFENDKIVEAWEMADEAALLRQLESWLPKRSDGLSIAPTINHPVDYGSQTLVNILSQPNESDTYTNKVRVSAYKSSFQPRNQGKPYLRPDNQVFDGRPYEVYTRRGFFHVAERSMELGTNDQGMGQAFLDRIDMVGKLIAEGDKVMIQFLLSATNTGSLFGIPASNASVGAWEVGVHTFDGTNWKEGWWFGDDVGLLLQIGAPGEFLIPIKGE